MQLSRVALMPQFVNRLICHDCLESVEVLGPSLVLE
jgi:hypothetical protein